MSKARIEHINITVTDRHRTAQMLADIFGWHIRWQGKSASGGDTIHVGSDEDSYLAIYTRPEGAPGKPINGRLNHVGILVDDLNDTEQKVAAAGYEPFNHGDYEPGRRFYFIDHDGVEFEIVSYA